MKQNIVVKYTLITALISGSIIPFSGYFVLLILFFYLMFSGELKKKLPLVLQQKSVAIGFIYIMFSLSRSNYKVDSLIGTLVVFFVISIYFVIRMYVSSINDTKDIFKFFIISNIIVSTYGIIQFYFIHNSYFSSGWIDSKVYDINMRAYSSLLNPNVLGGYLVFCICIQLTCLENIRYRKMNFISLMFSSFCLILTYSRGAWFTLVIIILLLYFYRKKVQYILYSFAFFITLILVNGNSGIERLNPNKSLQDNSVLYRIEIYKSTLKIIKEHFFFGTGLNTMKYYINYYSQVITSPVYHAHNLILNILGETGFVGLIIFCRILFELFKNLYYIHRLEDDLYRDISVSVFLSFLSILIHGFVDAPIIAPQFLFFTIYIYSFTANIKHMKNSFNKSSELYSCRRNNSGGEIYETKNNSFEKSRFRA